MKTEILTACDQLVTAIINGIYQGVILVFLVALGLRFLGRTTNAATRHAIWFCTLLLLVLIVPAHCLRDYLALAPRANPSEVNELAAVAASDTDPGVRMMSLPTPDPSPTEAVFHPSPSPTVLRQQHYGGLETRRASGEHDGGQDGGRIIEMQPPYLNSFTVEHYEKSAAPLFDFETAWIVERVESGPVIPLATEDPSPTSHATVEYLAAQTRMPPLAQAILEAASAAEADSVEEAGTPFWQSLKERFGGAASALMSPVSWKVALGNRLPRSASMIVLGCLLSLALIRISILLFRLYRIRELKRLSLAPTGDLTETFCRLRRGLAVKRGVDLKVSPAIRSPVLLGFLNPVILLPAEATPAEAEPVLRHELAHVHRRDDWANLVQHFIHALFFFHPGVWWVSKRLSLEREIACDDHVLQSGRPRAYALLLADLAGRIKGCPPLLAPGASTNKSQLQQRIDMILDTKRNTSPRLAKTRLGFITSAAALLAIAAIYSAPRVVLAQSDTAPVAAAATAPKAAGTSADVAPAGAAVVAIAPVAVAVTSADIDEPAPVPPVAPGAKSKPGNARAVTIWPRAVTAPAPDAPNTPNVPNAPLALPAPVTAPAIVVQPGTPMPPAALAAGEPRPPRAARPGRTPRPGDADSSIEERMERLERMVESLVSQQSLLKPGQMHMMGPNDLIDRKEIEKIEKFAREHADFAKKHALDQKQIDWIQEYAKAQADFAKKQAMDPKEIEKLKMHAEREAKVAVDQAKRAVAQAERSAKADQKRQFNFKFKDGSRKQQLEALRRQAEALERQKEKLDQQIEELEQQQEQLNEQQDEDQAENEAQPERSEEECTAKAAAKR